MQNDYILEKEKEQEKEWLLKEYPFLLSKDMFFTITDKILDDFIVGEYEARQTIFLCSCGHLVENCNIASFNLLVNDSAGTGKDYITSKILEVWGVKCIKRTRISPTVFTYWHNSKFEPTWTWNGKILYLEDVSNAVLNSSVFKVMCSSGSHTTVVKDQRAIDIKIEGKPIMIITSATAAPNPELTRRFTIVNLDSGIEQTKAIMKRHLKYAVDGKKIEMDREVLYSLLNLHPVKVRIPYAEKLFKHLPTESVIMRTHILRLIDYIKASCAFYQFQREKDEDGFYIATEQDYQIAKIAIIKTTSNQYMIPLTKDQKKILAVFEKIDEEHNHWYTVNDLEVNISWLSDKWLRQQLDKLVEYGLLIKDKQVNDNGRQALIYNYPGNIQLKLPDKLED